MPFPSLDEVLNKSPKLSKTDLEYLQEWMSKQPHLPQLEDIDLVPFLNRCDYRLERTKDLLDKYLTMRTHAPEIFKYRDVTSAIVKEQSKYFHVAVSGRDARGRAVVCAGWGDADLSGIDLECCAFIAFSLVELYLRENPTLSGAVFVLDAAGLQSGHITKASVSLVKKTLAFLQDAITLDIATIHVIRLNSLVDKFMLIIKPFLSKETQDKLKFHSKNIDAIFEFIPKTALPENYGGTLPPSETFYDKLIDNLVANAEWLKTLDRRAVDESRRPGRAKGEGDVFGVDGSFKKLDFD